MNTGQMPHLEVQMGPKRYKQCALVLRASGVHGGNRNDALRPHLYEESSCFLTKTRHPDDLIGSSSVWK